MKDLHTELADTYHKLAPKIELSKVMKKFSPESIEKLKSLGFTDEMIQELFNQRKNT